MKIQTHLIKKYYGLIFCITFLFSCRENIQVVKNCTKFSKEIYKEVVPDTALVKGIFNYQKSLLERFGEISVKGLDYEAYHLQFYSSHGIGKSVKFEDKNGVCIITVKCRTNENWLPDCKEYQISLEREEWNQLEKMIYEFDFWTSEDFKPNNDVLDGSSYLLEGNRPQAEKCNKKTYKLVARASPKYDKMGALCNYILEYEDQLKSKYEQLMK